MGVYRLIRLCGVLVLLWVVQVVALESFKRGISAPPPQYNIVDFDRDFRLSTDQRPLVEIAKDRGWNDSLVFVTAEGAREIERDYRRKKLLAWAALSIALLAAGTIVFMAHRLWGSWWLGFAAALLGPAAIAWGMRELRR